MGLLSNKIAVVTGAASGIGQATAIKFAQEGAKVALIDLQDTEETKRLIEDAGSEALCFETDVSDPEQMEESFSTAAKEWGRIDVVLANAGMNGTVAPIEDMEPHKWDKTIETNLRSTFLSVKYAIPHMKEHGGSIIITSSVNGNRTFSNMGMTAYSSSKAGQMAFGKMAALELAGYKIRVNIMCPGYVETNIFDRTYTEGIEKIELPVKTEMDESADTLLNQPAKAEKAADLVLFLASENSSHISGSEIYLDGAQSLM